MIELAKKNFYMNEMSEIIINEDKEIFVIQKNYNKNFKINEITAFLLKKLNQVPLNIEQMVSLLNQSYSDLGKIEYKMVEPIIMNLFKNGILACEGIEENIPVKKMPKSILKFEMNPTLLDGEVEINTNFLFQSKLKLILFVICLILFAFSFYFYTLSVAIKDFYFNYSSVLTIFPIFLVHIVGHELAHMYVCKKMGGKVSKIGVGLLYYFIPVAFVTYKDTYKISKTSRAKIAIAGPLFDLTLLLIVSIILLLTNNNTIQSLILPYSILIFSMQFFNLNILMPSDLYRFLESLSGHYNIRRKSFSYLLRIFNRKKSNLTYEKEKKLGTKVFYITYSFLSLCYIVFLLGCMLWTINNII